MAASLLYICILPFITEKSEPEAKSICLCFIGTVDLQTSVPMVLQSPIKSKHINFHFSYYFLRSPIKKKYGWRGSVYNIISALMQVSKGLRICSAPIGENTESHTEKYFTEQAELGNSEIAPTGRVLCPKLFTQGYLSFAKRRFWIEVSRDNYRLK